MLIVPERFNKNAADVRKMASPAETGAWLIEYMCRRIGILEKRHEFLRLGASCQIRHQQHRVTPLNLFSVISR